MEFEDLSDPKAIYRVGTYKCKVMSHSTLQHRCGKTTLEIRFVSLRGDAEFYVMVSGLLPEILNNLELKKCQ